MTLDRGHGAIRHARWVAHVNGVNADGDMRDWLTDTVSLTRKLMSHSQSFRVQRLRQERGLCLTDECTAVSLTRRGLVQEREVLLECDGRPVVFAHTIVPLSATAADWPFFGTLGERSLGTTLFGDPQVERGALHYARLNARHPLVERACRALRVRDQLVPSLVAPLFARRCLYRRRRGLLLVTEVFLPAVTALKAYAAE